MQISFTSQESGVGRPNKASSYNNPFQGFTSSIHIMTNDCLLLSYKRSLGSCLIRYYVCRKARGSNKSACRSVMCAGCYDKMSFGGDEETGNRRSSSRSVKRKLSEKDDNIHATDANGCTHSNPDSFQAEYNGMYFDDAWRSKQDKANLLDETCLQCNGNVMDGGM